MVFVVNLTTPVAPLRATTGLGEVFLIVEKAQENPEPGSISTLALYAYKYNGGQIRQIMIFSY